MNSNIDRLYKIGSKKSRLIIGLMSGTSLDGLDIVLCKVTSSGTQTKIALKAFETVPYSKSLKSKINKVFAKPLVNFASLCELNAFIGFLHADMILTCLSKWKYKPSDIDVIASHGQTVFHGPKTTTKGAKLNSTLQIGDGDHLAQRTGIITISDFRQKHVAAGGEGAPLAVYGDYLIFSRKGEDRVMINIGGIGNFTYLAADCDAKKVFVTDTGPGNTLIDQLSQRYFSKPFDKNAKLAKKGKVNFTLLKEMKAHAFFRQKIPKTTGPELFNLAFVESCQRASRTTKINPYDLLATITRLSAESLCDEIKKAVGKKKINAFLSGGGAHNPLMVQWLRELLPNATFANLDTLGFPGDAKEAILFAVLANELLAGGVTDYGKRNKVPSVSMGKVSFPD